MVIRSEGPLALLKLRNFRLPENIFNVDATQTQAMAQTDAEATDSGDIY